MFNVDESQFKITDSTILVHYCMASWGTPMFRLQLTLKKNLAFLLGGVQQNSKITQKAQKLVGRSHVPFLQSIKSWNGGAIHESNS